MKIVEGALMRSSIGLLLALTIAGTGISGCASNPPLMVAAADSGSYHLGAGDKLRVTVYNEPNLTGEYSVTTAGNVAFPLVGMIPVKDRTTEDVTAAIAAKLADGYVNDPKVSVEILNYRPFYILGEVAKPGEYAFVNGMTIEQAVAAAGGFTYRANQKTVFLRRGENNGERSVKVRERPIPVLPGDTIRVGERYF